MKKGFYLKKKNLYSYSFLPFIISLYKEDIIQLVEILKSNYPDAKIFLGKDGLDFDFTSRLDMEEFLKQDEIKKSVYNSLYIRINTGPNEEDPFLIIEMDQYSYNYLITGRDQKLFKVKNEVLRIIKHNKVYKYIRNPFTITLTLAINVLIFLFIFKFKDKVEKILNVSFSYITILLIFFIVNLIFILPSGKNRIFLKPKKEVPLLNRAREAFLFLGMFLTFLSFFIIGYFLKIL